MFALDDEARRLWVTQLRLECKSLDHSGQRLHRIDGDNPDEIATVMVARFHDGFAIAFDAAADPDLVERASTVRPEQYFEDSTAVAGQLGDGREIRVGTYSTYRFAPAASTVDPSIMRRGPEDHAVVVDDREVSCASSSRSNDEAAELWVRTDDSARRRGYGLRVAKAWAAEVMGTGRVAFYSHLADNAPSRRLAEKLGVVHLFDLATLTLTADAKPRATDT